ncbi:MAG: DUF881 domain-containing protein, partial [Firmicutes bacterium]|nr:DUF881 domain-containing protein [Bacillota bacterium]
MFNRVQLSLTITLLTLGILMSIQFRTTQEVLKSLTSQSQQDLAVTLKNLSEKKYTLQKEFWDLQVKVTSLDSASLQRNDVVKSLQEELDKLNGASGAAALNGPGIKIIVSKSTPIVTDELISIVNELWNVGAEGIVVNGKRITSFIPITEGIFDGSIETAIAGEPLKYPYVITAIGDPEKLINGINIVGGTIDLMRVNKTVIHVEKQEDLVLPVAQQPLKFQYARVTDQPVPTPAPG